MNQTSGKGSQNSSFSSLSSEIVNFIHNDFNSKLNIDNLEGSVKDDYRETDVTSVKDSNSVRKN